VAGLVPGSMVDWAVVRDLAPAAALAGLHRIPPQQRRGRCSGPAL